GRIWKRSYEVRLSLWERPRASAGEGCVRDFNVREDTHPSPQPAPRGRGSYVESPKAWLAVSAIMRPIASEDVAPGEGALRTWTMRLPWVLKTKSSTSDPSGPSACARTPLGPGSRSARVSSGT